MKWIPAAPSHCRDRLLLLLLSPTSPGGYYLSACCQWKHHITVRVMKERAKRGVPLTLHQQTSNHLFPQKDHVKTEATVLNETVYVQELIKHKTYLLVSIIKLRVQAYWLTCAKSLCYILLRLLSSVVVTNLFKAQDPKAQPRSLEMNCNIVFPNWGLYICAACI